MNKIFILGMGPGNEEYVLPKTKEIIEKCDVLIGGSRHLKPYESSGKILIPIGRDLQKVSILARDYSKDKKVAFMLSGDTGFYSMLNYIKKDFKIVELEIIPGISSFQYLAAKIGESWHDAFVGSFHGRELDLVDILHKFNKAFLLTDNNNSPRKIAEFLIHNGFENINMIVGEELSYSNEKITIGTPKDILALENFAMAVVVIKNAVEI